MKLRSADLRLPAAAQAAEFMDRIWGTPRVATLGGTHYLRGTGSHPYIYSLTEAPQRGTGPITFAGTPEEIAAAKARAQAAGVRLRESGSFDVPGGGAGVEVEGPEGQVYRLIEDGAALPVADDRDRPIQITHVVLNCREVAKLEKFSTEILGFRISDRTKMMTFVRCNRKHHCLAYAHADVSTLNHVAFEMASTDAVMKGLARMREAGLDTVWGPGRHGPGNNVFNYFIAPFGAVIEYTAEVSEVDDHYKVGAPEDWKWPPGRIDHWGISVKDTARIGAAERQWGFAPL